VVVEELGARRVDIYGHRRGEMRWAGCPRPARRCELVGRKPRRWGVDDVAAARAVGGGGGPGRTARGK
jgi:hypothetical protein